MAYSIGHISGCHINPAVTLAFLVTKKIGVVRAVNYWIAQLLGGIAGGAVIYALADLNGKTGFDSNGWGKDGSPTGRGFGAMVIAEVVFTAILVFVVLSTTNKSFPTGLGGIAVGATLAAIHLVTIPVDNTSVNPARSLGTAVFSNTNLPHLKQLWAFFVFPAIGAIVGALVWLATDEATLEGTMAASLVD